MEYIQSCFSGETLKYFLEVFKSHAPRTALAESAVGRPKFPVPGSVNIPPRKNYLRCAHKTPTLTELNYDNYYYAKMAAAERGVVMTVREEDLPSLAVASIIFVALVVLLAAATVFVLGILIACRRRRRRKMILSTLQRRQCSARAGARATQLRQAIRRKQVLRKSPRQLRSGLNPRRRHASDVAAHLNIGCPACLRYAR